MRILVASSLFWVGLAGCGRQDDEGTEVEVEAVLTGITRARTPEEVAPYDEAFVINEYEVSRVLRGRLDTPTVRVARWTVSGGKAQPAVGSAGSVATLTLVPLDGVEGLNRIRTYDDLPFDPDAVRYLDFGQSLQAPDVPRDLRYDYGSDLAWRMRIYWALRHQLRLVVTGNSHTANAVLPHLFFQPENLNTPMALNMSPAGSGITMQCLLIDEYFADLPRLEWIVWGISPRVFNKKTPDDRRREMFEASFGFRHDQKHRDELWPVDTDAQPVRVVDLKMRLGKGHPAWGERRARESQLPSSFGAEAEEKIRARADPDNFEWSQKMWEQFEAQVSKLTERGIKVLLFIPPFHPVVVGWPTADTDGTGHDDYRKIVERLGELAAGDERVFFVDTHRRGEHEFSHEDFADGDHLLERGALRLTPKLVEIVEENSE